MALQSLEDHESVILIGNSYDTCCQPPQIKLCLFSHLWGACGSSGEKAVKKAGLQIERQRERN